MQLKIVKASRERFMGPPGKNGESSYLPKNRRHSSRTESNTKAFLRGDPPHRGHRMRGPDGSRLFSLSTSRSKTTDDLAASSTGLDVSSYAAAATLRTANDNITRVTPLMIMLTPTKTPIAQTALDGHCR
jgi:hypothetical protein